MRIPGSPHVHLLKSLPILSFDEQLRQFGPAGHWKLSIKIRISGGEKVSWGNLCQPVQPVAQGQGASEQAKEHVHLQWNPNEIETLYYQSPTTPIIRRTTP